MIKFFRRIRQQLVWKNNFGKYLLYAIGEIILLVIGILFALQINNWNEQNKTDKKAELIFKELYGELHETSEILQEARIGNERYLRFVESTLDNWHHLDLEIVESFERTEFQKSNFSVLFYLFSYAQFNDPQDDIFKKAISEGTISLVENKFVKELSALYRLIPRLNEMIKQEYDISKEITLHIAKTYNTTLNQMSRMDSKKIDSIAVNSLLRSFRDDGTLKYLLNAKLEFATVRNVLLTSMNKDIVETLGRFKASENDKPKKDKTIK